MADKEAKRVLASLSEEKAYKISRQDYIELSIEDFGYLDFMLPKINEWKSLTGIRNGCITDV